MVKRTVVNTPNLKIIKSIKKIKLNDKYENGIVEIQEKPVYYKTINDYGQPEYEQNDQYVNNTNQSGEYIEDNQETEYEQEEITNPQIQQYTTRDNVIRMRRHPVPKMQSYYPNATSRISELAFQQFLQTEQGQKILNSITTMEQQNEEKREGLLSKLKKIVSNKWVVGTVLTAGAIGTAGYMGFTPAFAMNSVYKYLTERSKETLSDGQIKEKSSILEGVFPYLITNNCGNSATCIERLNQLPPDEKLSLIGSQFMKGALGFNTKLYSKADIVKDTTKDSANFLNETLISPTINLTKDTVKGTYDYVSGGIKSFGDVVSNVFG
jgi:hypothetical protein